MSFLLLMTDSLSNNIPSIQDERSDVMDEELEA